MVFVIFVLPISCGFFIAKRNFSLYVMILLTSKLLSGLVNVMLFSH
jgi:hypothetical protein